MKIALCPFSGEPKHIQRKLKIKKEGKDPITTQAFVAKMGELSQKEFAVLDGLFESPDLFEFETWEEAKSYFTSYGDLKDQIEGELTNAGVPDDLRDVAFEQTLYKRLGVLHQYATHFRHRFKESGLSAQKQDHIAEFIREGAHAFVPEWVFKKQTSGNKRDRWGWANPRSKDNFVSTKPAADAILNKAVSGKGLQALEQELGIPPGSWSENGKLNHIYRFYIPADRLSKFGIRVAEGVEGGAYPKEWLGGMKTLQGVKEAVVSGLATNKDLQAAVSAGDIEICRVTFSKGSKRQPHEQRIRNI